MNAPHKFIVCKTIPSFKRILTHHLWVTSAMLGVWGVGVVKIDIVFVGRKVGWQLGLQEKLGETCL